MTGDLATFSVTAQATVSDVEGDADVVLDQFRLDGKVAAITGPTSGLGAAIAVALAQAGADIVGLHRGRVATTQTAVEETGRRFYPVPVDLETVGADECASIVETALRAAGRIDVLVNNAGTITRSPALDVTKQDWDKVLHTNLTAAFLLTQAVGRHLMRRPDTDGNGARGKVINIASMLSFQGGINVAAYTASKSGLAGLTRVLANEWAPSRINVNAIAPGYIQTPATEALQADPDRSPQILNRIPAARWGHPDDLAGAAVFLASAASDYIHGAIIPVDGGWLAR
ncbi:2-dehydro-3-deoxy-D-gluconate 5-dehydrogenase KduD [Kribbella sp. NPDC050820]|uniref:2-dehydro-3-deoxy-D-gluconate 5-dehydrogenase KduD n=1 Tax=Kribbella sp. NPDC050820 TaxID=3155408 RepID=UPI0033DE1E5A